MKKIINTAILSAVVVASAVSAQAADYNVNMYGASAQINYWNALMDDFLLTQGCDTTEQARVDSKKIAFKGTNCGVDDNSTYYITYTSVASLEGLKAVKGESSIDPSLICDGSDLNKRSVANAATCTNWKPAGGTAWGTCTAACLPIDVGASDVEGVSFHQRSVGNKYGHKGGGLDTDVYTADSVELSEVDYQRYQPTVVPFSFYVNNRIGGQYAAGIKNNLSRVMAANLFGGKVSNWTQFRGYEDYTYDIALCLRHAGSGTHATLDEVVFRGDNIELLEVQNGTTAPYTYFYQSSSSTTTGTAGMKECIQQNAGKSSAAAVGYMDADVASSSSLHRMTYNGVPSVDLEEKEDPITHIMYKANDYINQGSYEFWSAQNLYIDLANTDKTLVDLMMNFANSNIPDNMKGIWTTDADLKVTKEFDVNLPVID